MEVILHTGLYINKRLATENVEPNVISTVILLLLTMLNFNHKKTDHFK